MLKKIMEESMTRKPQKITMIIILFFFSFSFLISETAYEGGNDELLKKSEILFEKGQYNETITLLLKFIKENINNWSMDYKIAKAYYILANIYFKNDEKDSKVEKLILKALFLRSDFIPNGKDIEFNKHFLEIKERRLLEKRKEMEIIKQKKKEIKIDKEETEEVKEEREREEKEEKMLKDGILGNYGLKIFFNFSNLHISKIDSQRWSSKKNFGLGLFYEKYLFSKTYFIPELYYIKKGSSILDLYGDQIIDLNYIEMRMLFEHRVNSTHQFYMVDLTKNLYFYFHGGFYLSYLINEKSIFRYKELEVDQSGNIAYKKFDYGLVLGTGIEIGKWRMGFSQTIPLININKDNDVRGNGVMKNKTFRIEIGYRFN